jgi:ribosomal-protein-alanine N-acetyltransferase
MPGTFLAQAPGGFVVGRAAAGEAELLTLAVAPEARRAGLGARLTARFAAEARALGAAEAFLEVAADNAAARALYAKAGYTEAGLRRAYYRTPAGETVDALILRCSLTEGHLRNPQAFARKADRQS